MVREIKFRAYQKVTTRPREGVKDLYRIAKRRQAFRKDLSRVKCMKISDGKVGREKGVMR